MSAQFPTADGGDAGKWCPTGTGYGHHFPNGRAPKAWVKVTKYQDIAAEKGIGKKKIAAAYKEGGKKGVEIEGAADMSGLEFFCTRSIAAEGNLDLLNVVMEGMNAEPEPGTESEERKGCSGSIGKVIISDNEELKQVVLVAYVDKENPKVSAKEWLEGILSTDLGGGMRGVIQPGADAFYANAICTENVETGHFYLKMKDTALTAAINYVRSRGLFPADESDGDDENYGADYEW